MKNPPLKAKLEGPGGAQEQASFSCCPESLCSPRDRPGDFCGPVGLSMSYCSNFERIRVPRAGLPDFWGPVHLRMGHWEDWEAALWNRA